MNWKLQCFPFHTWGPWRELERGDIMRGSKLLPITGESRHVGNYLIQERECIICHKKELNQQQEVLT